MNKARKAIVAILLCAAAVPAAFAQSNACPPRPSPGSVVNNPLDLYSSARVLSAAFTTIGIGITRFIPNAESGPVVVNLAVLPLTFISNIWFPTDALPHVLRTIAGIFPIKALASGLQYVFDPRYHGAGLNGHARIR